MSRSVHEPPGVATYNELGHIVLTGIAQILKNRILRHEASSAKDPSAPSPLILSSGARRRICLAIHIASKHRHSFVENLKIKSF